MSCGRIRLARIALGALVAMLMLPALARADVGGWSSSAWSGCSAGTNSGGWDDAGLVYVPCGNPSTIGAYDVAGYLVRSITTGRMVTDVAPTRDGRYLYLAGPGPLSRLVRQDNGNYVVDTGWHASAYSIWGESKPASNGRYVTTDAAGNVYYADGAWGSNLTHTVVKYAPDGSVITRFGEWANSWQRGTFYWMLGGLAVTADGSTLYTAEVGNNRLQRWERQSDGSYVSVATFGSNEANNPTREGFCDYDSWRGTFAAPYDVALDAAGNVYVMNTTCKQVIGFTADLSRMRLSADVRVAGGDYPRPHGFAVGRDGSVFVGENQRVLHPGGATHPSDGHPPVPVSSAPAPTTPVRSIPTGTPPATSPVAPVLTPRPQRPIQADTAAPMLSIGRVSVFMRALSAPVRCNERCRVELVVQRGGRTAARRVAWLSASRRSSIAVRFARMPHVRTLAVRIQVRDPYGNTARYRRIVRLRS